MGDRRDPIEEGITCRRSCRTRCPHSNGELDHHQGEYQHSARHVYPQNTNLLRIDIWHRREHEKTYGQRRDDQDGKQPRQRHQQRMIAGAPASFSIPPERRQAAAPVSSPAITPNYREGTAPKVVETRISCARLVCDGLHITSGDPTSLTLNVASPPPCGGTSAVAGKPDLSPTTSIRR